MAYQGKFQPKNPQKYRGDLSNIVFRSLWELKVFQWCDTHPKVSMWSSEETIVPYICPTDGRAHRYFVDVLIEYVDGTTVMVEVKPEYQTRPPVPKKGKKRETLILEAATFAKNDAKWKAAVDYCQRRGWSFQIWTEKTLEKKGIMTQITRAPKKP